MSATIRNDQGVAIASLAGEVRGEDALAELFELVTGPSARIVLDMSGVSFLSSAGIGDLVRLVAHANTQEARIVIAAPSSFVADILEVTQLDRFFEIYEGVEQAVTAIR